MPSNPRNAGRPSRTVSLNLNNIDLTVQNVMNICNNDYTQRLVLDLCDMLKNNLVTKSEKETQSHSHITSSKKTQANITTKVESVMTQTEIPMNN